MPGVPRTRAEWNQTQSQSCLFVAHPHRIQRRIPILPWRGERKPKACTLCIFIVRPIAQGRAYLERCWPSLLPVMWGIANCPLGCLLPMATQSACEPVRGFHFARNDSGGQKMGEFFFWYASNVRGPPFTSLPGLPDLLLRCRSLL